MARSFAPMARAFGLTTVFLVSRGPDAHGTGLSQDCSPIGVYVSTFAVAGLGVFDIVTAPSSARRYNESRLSIAPIVDIRRHSYGLSFAWSYGKAMRAPRDRASVQARKSAAGAFVLSLASTGVPMVVGAAAGGGGGWGWVFLGGVVVGPSVGHLYAEQFGRGLGTAALRGLGTAVGIASLVGCFD